MPKSVVPFAVRPLSNGGTYVNTPVELLYERPPLLAAAPSLPTERSVRAIPLPPPPPDDAKVIESPLAFVVIVMLLPATRVNVSFA